MYDSTSQQCICGDDLGGVIGCDNEEQRAYIMRCYCMTYDNQIGVTVGSCFTNCFYGCVHKAYFKSVSRSALIIANYGILRVNLKTLILVNRCHIGWTTMNHSLQIIQMLIYHSMEQLNTQTTQYIDYLYRIALLLTAEVTYSNNRLIILCHYCYTMHNHKLRYIILYSKENKIMHYNCLIFHVLFVLTWHRQHQSPCYHT